MTGWISVNWHGKEGCVCAHMSVWKRRGCQRTDIPFAPSRMDDPEAPAPLQSPPSCFGSCLKVQGWQRIQWTGSCRFTLGRHTAQNQHCTAEPGRPGCQSSCGRVLTGFTLWHITSFSMPPLTNEWGWWQYPHAPVTMAAKQIGPNVVF